MRAAVVGFGGMGQRHYKAYAGTPFDVVAICERFPERVKAVLPDFPDSKIYPDYRDLLAAEQLDILSVASNGPTHAEITIAAADAGVPRILCEKPIGTSLAEGQQVADAARRTGARVAVNHIRRWSPTYRLLRDKIVDGTFGPVRHIYYHSGSTGLGNFALHVFDLMRFLNGGECAWVVGALDATGTPNPRGAHFVDPGGFGMLMFGDGMRGLIDTGEDTGIHYLFVIATPHARIVVDELGGTCTARVRDASSRALPFTRYGSPMADFPLPQMPHDIVALTRAAIVELAGDGPISATIDDGIKAVELVLAFHASHQQRNGRVDLPLSGAARDISVPIA
jgi:predicted dehydrogenase